MVHVKGSKSDIPVLKHDISLLPSLAASQNLLKHLTTLHGPKRPHNSTSRVQVQEATRNQRSSAYHWRKPAYEAEVMAATQAWAIAQWIPMRLDETPAFGTSYKTGSFATTGAKERHPDQHDSAQAAAWFESSLARWLQTRRVEVLVCSPYSRRLCGPHGFLPLPRLRHPRQPPKNPQTKSRPISQGEHGKSEGTDPTGWAYQPPEGAVLQEDPTSGEFNWDSLNVDEELELWPIVYTRPRECEILQKSHSYNIWNDDMDLSTAFYLVRLSLNTNLMIALSPQQIMLSSLATEFSLILPSPGTPLISYFPERDALANVTPIAVSESPLLAPNAPPVWFSGIPFARENNPLIVPILNAPEESFAADSDSSTDTLADAAEKGGEGLWAGSQLGVVSSFQALSSARVTWVGGVDLFTDKFANKEISKGLKSGNMQFVRDVAAWTFQESLVLHIEDADHHIANTTISKEQYTINNPIVYSAAITQFNAKEDAWELYPNIKDMRLEFTMLDPHIRTALPPFVIDYKCKGWMHLHHSITVAVMPPWHDGYPRFLGAAWPYYAGAISTSVGFFLFSAMWLAGDVRQSKKSKSQKTE
ncbi:Oligosaccharyltransferase 48 kDa subunit beta-domain-containing protein [Armillaria nabsnona]|nr:Oligosaccharyltransferase 48 kDa subunit beta-domain-containing protein [Armillaria nabsnona]